MKRSIVVLTLLVLAAACGPPATTAARPASPAASGSPAAVPPSSTPVPAGETLFAVLERSRSDAFSPDTVAIAGLDGRARAKARFRPRATPWVAADLGPLLPAIAHVAAGRVFYVDGDGVVRSLGADGTIREVTRFPVTAAQQEVSFAVSPDGRELAGSVVTLPPKPDPPPTPGYVPSGPYAMDVMTATAGSPATVTYHRSWTYADHVGSGAQFIAWDQGGPLATLPSMLGTQGGGPHQWNGPTLVHFPNGRPGSTLPAPAGCVPMDLLRSGVFVCGAGDEAFEVLGPDGGARWHYQGPKGRDTLLYCFLSPDAQRVVSFGPSTSAVYTAVGSPVALPSGFYHDGWIDSRIVAGSLTSGHVAYVSLANPGRAVDLGFVGDFVGAVTA
jgi:hypothetical protein